MKQWFAIAVMGLCFFSCKKDVSPSSQQRIISDESFFSSVKSELKDSLSNSDYSSLDESRWYKSKDAQSTNYFVRIAFQGKDLATDFILLKADSVGDIKDGRIIHADKANDVKNSNDFLFRGQFVINSLNRKISVAREVVNGRWKRVNNETSLLEEEPAGTQDLPEVVVTSYTSDGAYSGDWYWYGGFYDYGYGGGGGGYTYGSSGGGGGGSAGTTTTPVHEDKTMNIEVESNDDSPIKVSDYTKCFSTVPDANATYQITLYADIPVNGDPGQLFNYSTGEVGHTFVQLRKVSGSSSVQQNIGFYPVTGWKSLSSANVDSKMVDNAGHKFNSSLTASISSTEFQAALNTAQSLSDRDYNIETWNCTDFALAVFNATNTGETLTIPKFQIPGTNTYSNTPQGLFDTMKGFQNNGNDSYGQIDIPGVCGYVGESHGSCGGSDNP